jgi:hypothetical protein
VLERSPAPAWSITVARPAVEARRVIEATSSRRSLTTAGLLVIALAGLLIWLLGRQISTPTIRDDAGSAQDLARRIGCESAYQDAQQPGSSSSAGSCTIKGAVVELRVYRTLGEAQAWLDGAKGQSGNPGTAGWGGVGNDWAVRITGTRDVDTVNDVLAALQS